MVRKFTISTLVVLALTAAAAPLIAATAPAARRAAPTASPADIVRARIAGYREMGAAFKNVMDGLRGGDAQIIMIQQGTRTIKATSQAQFRWFPVGSGPAPGLKTLAKPEIWAKSAEFRAAQDGLVRAADALQAAATSGNVNAIRGAARGLGAACKTCHDQFRTPPTQ